MAERSWYQDSINLLTHERIDRQDPYIHASFREEEEKKKKKKKKRTGKLRNHHQ
jgi:hypothetical protein